jgi:SNF family Na+-dependent transporter
VKRTFLITAALFLFFVLLISQAMAQPKMFLPEESFNFGFAPQNSKISHTFWIKSVGDDSLKILNVKPG